MLSLVVTVSGFDNNKTNHFLRTEKTRIAIESGREHFLLGRQNL